MIIKKKPQEIIILNFYGNNSDKNKLFECIESIYNKELDLINYKKLALERNKEVMLETAAMI